MAEPIDVAPGVRVPAAALAMRSVRASGPGGQNVNKVSSRVELAVEMAAIEGLDADALARLRAIAGKRVDAEGRLRVTAQESRDRSRNLETAREKVRALVSRALVEPKRRKATRPGAGDRAARLAVKKRDARIKAGRRAPGLDD